MTALLEIERLSVAGADGHALLDNIDLRIEAGEALGVVGESGSGKSLTALSILRLLPDGLRQSGSIRFEGRPLQQLREPELQRIRGARMGMIFQEPMTALNPLMSIGAQVAEVVRLHLRRARAVRRTGARCVGARGSGRAAHRRALPASVVRRPAPARRHRHGPGGLAAVGDRR